MGGGVERIRFGVIGLGLMGREFASAAARWQHVPGLHVAPEIVSICSRSLPADTVDWFKSISPGIEQVTDDYRDVLSNNQVDAVYIAVPHNLHEEMYSAAIRAGKHLFGEKPFGIDAAANQVINQAIAEHPQVLVRCTSQFPFVPAVQRLTSMIENDEFGTLLEVEAGFKHSSDLNPKKGINWKRKLETNGEYGCMGDLGMHVCHIPFRSGWAPLDVRAVLSNVMKERPDSSGNMVPCETWDNAIMLTTARDAEGSRFPMTLKTQRIAPGETNTWYLAVYGTRASARFSTKRINLLESLHYDGGEQNWETIDVGHKPAFPSITGGIFEFGFSDAILQMWAAYLYELVEGRPKSRFAACARPEELQLSHKLFSAALRSHRDSTLSVV
jgi:predicted dehydrogenase